MRDINASEKQYTIIQVLIYTVVGIMTFAPAFTGESLSFLYGVFGIIFFTLAFMVYAVYKSRKAEREKLKMEVQSEIQSKYSHSNFGYRTFDYSIVGIKNRKLVIVLSENGDIDITDMKSFNISEVLKVEVITDKNELLDNTVSSSVAGAVVGGVLFGGAGAVSGAVIGSGKAPVKHITLRFIMKDFIKDKIDVEIYNVLWFSVDHGERENRVELLKELLSTLEVLEKR